MPAPANHKRLLISTIILVIVHLAGIIGIHTPYKELFLALSPLNLLLSALLLLWNHKNFNNATLSFLIITAVAGFLVEVAGVHTRLIFGSYLYGKTLGLKLFDVPLIIGINWMMLVYCAGTIVNRLNAGTVIKSLAGAALLVAMDLLIEPVAIRYDFWDWYEGSIPLRNYIAWFVVSFLLLLLFNKLQFNKENKLAQSLFIIQLIFFAALCAF